jgi:hypothetical protein
VHRACEAQQNQSASRRPSVLRPHSWKPGPRHTGLLPSFAQNHETPCRNGLSLFRLPALRRNGLSLLRELQFMIAFIVFFPRARPIAGNPSAADTMRGHSCGNRLNIREPLKNALSGCASQRFVSATVAIDITTQIGYKSACCLPYTLPRRRLRIHDCAYAVDHYPKCLLCRIKLFPFTSLTTFGVRARPITELIEPMNNGCTLKASARAMAKNVVRPESTVATRPCNNSSYRGYANTTTYDQ